MCAWVCQYVCGGFLFSSFPVSGWVCTWIQLRWTKMRTFWSFKRNARTRTHSSIHLPGTHRDIDIYMIMLTFFENIPARWCNRTHTHWDKREIKKKTFFPTPLNALFMCRFCALFFLLPLLLRLTIKIPFQIVWVKYSSVVYVDCGIGQKKEILIQWNFGGNKKSCVIVRQFSIEASDGAHRCWLPCQYYRKKSQK